MVRNIDHLSKINLMSQKLSLELEGFISKEAFEFAEFSEAELSRRIRQIIFCEYSKDIHDICVSALEKGDLKNNHLIFKENNVEMKQGSGFYLKVSLKWRLKSIFAFLLTNLYLLLIFFRQLFLKVPSKKITLVLNPMLRDLYGGRDILKRFSLFCDEGKIEFLKKAELIICHCEKGDEIKNNRFVLTNNIYKSLIENTNISISDFFNFLRYFIADFFKFIFKVLINNSFVFLINDLKKIPFYRVLNNKSLENVVLSTGYIYAQEIWQKELKIKKFKEHFIWWGMSTSTLRFKGVETFEYAGAELHSSGLNYFWNEFHENEARDALGEIRESTISGPNLFYLQENKIDFHQEYILIFLNNPRTQEEMEKYLGKGFYYYGRYEVQAEFFHSINKEISAINERTGRSIKIFVKLKRKLIPNVFDPRFVKLVEELERNNQIIEFDTNLLDCVSKAKAVLCTPVSSPTYLGIDLKVPSAFYDPEHTVDDDYYQFPGLTWCSSREQLKTFLEDSLC
ncbi:MAG: hypothetical protein NXH75_02135 [Halobacteriovoraceae bacterium]|nr:hypothetical protein [Halobacteriovoraceae bacterium]